MIEKCKEKGINDHELENHKQIVETSFKASKESLGGCCYLKKNQILNLLDCPIKLL
jgi:hypothetical protein